MISTLPHIKAISVLDKKPTVGSEPLLVLGNDYQAYFVKNHRQLPTAATMINEVLGNLLLNAWQLPTPEIALIEMPEATLQGDWGERHKKSYYRRPAFGSKQVAGAFDLTPIANISGKVDYRKLMHPEEFARIGLFDMWVENDDRPPDLKNIMLHESDLRYRFLAIDQAMIFRTGAYDTLSNKKFWPTEGNYCIQSNYFHSLKRFYKFSNPNWAKIEQENFYLCINRCRSQFKDFRSLIPPDWGYTSEIEALIFDFLFDNDRNKEILNEYIRLFK
jgi:hypothetical protein